MAHRRYKIDLYARGVTATTGTITKTFPSSQIGSAPTLGGQLIRVAEGRVESEPWVVDILDNNSTTFTSLLSTGGRMHLLGRLVRVRQSLDSTASTAYSAVAVGRLTDVALNPDVASYRLTVSDERWMERQTEIFTAANTAMLIPPGIIGGFANNTVFGFGLSIPGEPPARWICRAVVGNSVLLEYADSRVLPRSEDIFKLIEDDVILGAVANRTTATTGSFTHLRWRNTASSTDYEVQSFAVRPTWTGAAGVSIEFLGPFPLGPNRNSHRADHLFMAVVWSASPPSVGAVLAGYLYAPTHPPTDALPLHIGGMMGQHPFAVVKDIYDGTYSNGITVRYSTAAMAALRADNRYGECWFRITKPMRMSEFLDDRLYAPYFVVPVADSSGKIAPKSLWNPSSAGVAGIQTITSTNALSHPTWQHPSREIVTVLRGTREAYQYLYDIRGQFGYAADRMQVTTAKDMVATHNNTSLLGRREQTRQFGAVDIALTTAMGLPGSFSLWKPWFAELSQHVFQRFGDGPIYTDVEVTSAITARPGDFIKMTVGTYPNPLTNARGSTRYLQILARRETPVGRSLTMLDLGADGNPLAVPTVSIALTTGFGSSRHNISGTVSGVAAGARWGLQVGAGASTASTATTAYISAGGGTTGTLTFTVGSLPSQRKIFARAFAYKAGRINSAYSTVDTVVTASISPPTGLTIGSVTAGSALATWTVGSTFYPIEVMVDATSTATMGSSNRIAMVPPLTARYQVVGLNANDGHKIAVRHRDPYGGFSNQDTTTFTTTTGYTAAPTMRGLTIVYGG